MIELNISDAVIIICNNYRITKQEIASHIEMTTMGLYKCIQSNKMKDKNKEMLIDIILNPQIIYKKIK